MKESIKAMAENWEKHIGTDCLNCGKTIDGKYCNRCGQRATDVKQTMWGLLTEYLEHGLSLDSNFARTILSLLSRPGQLTVDYNEGRRARYFSPVRLYLLMSLLFFWSLSLSGALGIDFNLDDETRQPATEESVGERIEKALARSGLEVDVDTSDSGIIEISTDDDLSLSSESVTDSTAVAGSDSTDSSFWSRFGRKLEDGGEKVADNPQMFKSKIFSTMSKTMFMLVPIFALLVRLLNVRRRVNYLPYMVFALHIHAVYFMIAAIFNILTHVLPAMEDLLQALLIFVFPVYIIAAMRRAFGGSWTRSWAKVALLMPAYGFCLAMGIAAAAVVQLVWFT
jgi:Protein of unknown function (DUF3667)